jgi:23S rRNA maturation-related 3'-5' exoribonuclease YhaM
MTELNRADLLMGTALGKIIPQEFADYLLKNGFYCAPASTKFHGNYAGGLFDHSFAVMNFLVELSAKNGLKWQRAESPFIVGMFHDLCKIDSYVPVMDGDETGFMHNLNTFLKGHGDKSIILLSQHITLTEEEVMCIRYHMGAFVEKDEWRDYTNAVHKYPNVLWTHHADMIASHVVGV